MMSEAGPTGGGYSIFHETIADMTYPELERAIGEGAVALWGLGVIEQHGPHLPLGTDAYIPYARLRRVRALLADRGVSAVVIPPFYWGVNQVTGAFTGSIHVRPEIMVEVMLDVFRSLAKDGFRRAFCVSGQGDALHNRALEEGVRRGRAETTLETYFVLPAVLAERLGLPADAPHLLRTPSPPPPGRYMDVHAGNGETSLMWSLFPGTVRAEVIPALQPTNLVAEDLAEWRKGGEHARRTTPLGYLGDPAAADPRRGREAFERDARATADAIAAAVGARA
jgi:creatinine amidohydrolase